MREEGAPQKPDNVKVAFHHLSGQGMNVTYHKQSVEIGLFSLQNDLSAMADAGLTVVEEYAGNSGSGGAHSGKRPEQYSESA